MYASARQSVTLRGLPVARWHRRVQCRPRMILVERRANHEASSVLASSYSDVGWLGRPQERWEYLWERRLAS
jgi:hypothetical protein